MSDAAIVELLAGRPGPHGTAFVDHEARAIAVARLPEVMQSMNGVDRMRLEHPAARVRAGSEWPEAVYSWKGRH